MKTVYVAGVRVRLTPAMLIAVGGEAEVYDLGDGRALKLFKTADHPDLADAPAEQQAARARLATHQNKLPDFPRDLPERVIAPRALATSHKRGGQITGYVMELVNPSEIFYRYGEPRLRHTTVPGNRVTGVLRDLRDTVAALHDRGIVIGDFNDLNVLVSNQRAYLIDADSFQFGPYSCPVFSERFVDPLLCDPNAQTPLLISPHRVGSDWYAFAVMVMRGLLCVGPYGGVYRPRDPDKRIAHAARPLRRVTVFDPEVVYPRPALHYGVLPDEFLAYLHGTFVADQRTAFPGDLLDDLRWTRCQACAREHARLVCPACQGKRGKNPCFSRVRGRVTADEIFTTTGIILSAARVVPSPGATRAGELDWLCWTNGRLENRDGTSLNPGNHGEASKDAVLPIPVPEPSPHRRFVCHAGGALIVDRGLLSLISPRGEVATRVIDMCAGDSGQSFDLATSNQRRVFWLASGQLWRQGDLGDVAIGAIVSGHTRIWASESYGFGFYRVGSLCTGFLFDLQHRGISDGISLPAMRGQFIAMHCLMAETRAWLAWTEVRSGRAWHGCALIARTGRSGQVIATTRDTSDSRDTSVNGHTGPDTTTWLANLAGGCAIGDFLFVPTDAGIQRIEPDGERLRVTRSFPDTEPFVDAATRLVPGSRGLYAVDRHRIVHLTLA